MGGKKAMQLRLQLSGACISILFTKMMVINEVWPRGVPAYYHALIGGGELLAGFFNFRGRQEDRARCIQGSHAEI